MKTTPEQSQLNLMPDRDIYSVGRLNREVRHQLETRFGTLWVEGELSNLRRPASGHWYFTLKDDRAQVKCAMFANRNRRLAFKAADGLKVLVRARISVYEPRGDYQLNIEEMEEAGEGALRRAFEMLKKKLAGEGLFDPQRKKSLPSLPKRIGVITSDSGAALRDVLKVLRRRFPAVPVLIYPVAVQGQNAPTEIVTALKLATRRGDCDVLLLTRGGGALEDLQAFNEEAVARAIAACAIPVICGVGHEIDFTIADFVADQRAPTPSAAAEMLVPDRREWLRQLANAETGLAATVARLITARRQHLRFTARRLQQQHPGQRLAQRGQRLDDLEQRLATTVRHRLVTRTARLSQAHSHLQRASPVQRIAPLRASIEQSSLRLQQAAVGSMNHLRNRLAVAARALDAVSPLATLERGYAIVTVKHRNQSRVIVDAGALREGDTVEARVARGIIEATVTAVREKDA